MIDSAECSCGYSYGAEDEAARHHFEADHTSSDWTLPAVWSLFEYPDLDSFFRDSLEEVEWTFLAEITVRASTKAEAIDLISDQAELVVREQLKP